MRKIEKIIIHCSASDDPLQDDIDQIKLLHTSHRNARFLWGKYDTNGKGFNDVGYHFFITKEGLIQYGRKLETPGAHCYRHNLDSIGICFSGEFLFSQNQFLAGQILVSDLMTRFNIDQSQIFPHNHFNENKSCPNFDVNILIKDSIRNEHNLEKKN